MACTWTSTQNSRENTQDWHYLFYTVPPVRLHSAQQRYVDWFCLYPGSLETKRSYTVHTPPPSIWIKAHNTWSHYSAVHTVVAMDGDPQKVTWCKSYGEFGVQHHNTICVPCRQTVTPLECSVRYVSVQLVARPQTRRGIKFRQIATTLTRRN